MFFFFPPQRTSFGTVALKGHSSVQHKTISAQFKKGKITAGKVCNRATLRSWHKWEKCQYGSHMALHTKVFPAKLKEWIKDFTFPCLQLLEIPLQCHLLQIIIFPRPSIGFKWGSFFFTTHIIWYEINQLISSPPYPGNKLSALRTFTHCSHIFVSQCANKKKKKVAPYTLWNFGTGRTLEKKIFFFFTSGHLKGLTKNAESTPTNLECPQHTWPCTLALLD